jgi:Eco29kI restriction endonuclease
VSAKPGRRRLHRAAWKRAEESEPYDPLDKTNLGRSVESALLARPRIGLTDVPPFYGAGIYALYYRGQHQLYQPIAESETPIYVGKAVPAGGRKGLTDQTRRTRALWKRVDEHRDSVEQTEDLAAADFAVRYLVADELFIPMAERLMIRGFAPVWNLVVDGFGNHDPGAKRRDGARPPWDELHPGRWWSRLMSNPSIVAAEISAALIADHLERHPAVVTIEAHPPAPVLEDKEIPDFAIDSGSVEE